MSRDGLSFGAYACTYAGEKDVCDYFPEDARIGVEGDARTLNAEAAAHAVWNAIAYADAWMLLG